MARAAEDFREAPEPARNQRGEGLLVSEYIARVRKSEKAAKPKAPPQPNRHAARQAMRAKAKDKIKRGS